MEQNRDLDSVMGAGDHFKNAASLKSQMSREYCLIKHRLYALVIMFSFSTCIMAQNNNESESIEILTKVMMGLFFGGSSTTDDPSTTTSTTNSPTNAGQTGAHKFTFCKDGDIDQFCCEVDLDNNRILFTTQLHNDFKKADFGTFSIISAKTIDNEDGQSVAFSIIHIDGDTVFKKYDICLIVSDGLVTLISYDEELTALDEDVVFLIEANKVNENQYKELLNAVSYSSSSSNNSSSSPSNHDHLDFDEIDDLLFYGW